MREAIDSILNQTFQDYECIIINDGSTDSTSDILTSYNDPRIRIVTNEKNFGLTKSLNIGIELAQGEYIARADADDISLPDRFLEEVTFLDNNPDIAMVGTAREIIDEFGVKIRNEIPKKDPSFRDIYNGNPFQHSSVMIRKNVLLEFGGYDELFPACEDYALWLLIAKKYRVYNIPIPLCKWRLHAESVSVKNYKTQKFSSILARRIVTNQLNENDLKGIHKFGVLYLEDKLSKDEITDYLNGAASCYRNNDNYDKAQKIYLKLFFMNPGDYISFINYFRLFLGKKFVSVTSKIFSH